jgi:hypothetical protein
MRWDGLVPRELLAFVLFAAILVAGAFIYFEHPFYTPFSDTPGWECVSVPKGGVTCDKTQTPVQPNTP